MKSFLGGTFEGKARNMLNSLMVEEEEMRVVIFFRRGGEERRNEGVQKESGYSEGGDFQRLCRVGTESF